LVSLESSLCFDRCEVAPALNRAAAVVESVYLELLGDLAHATHDT
jgi:hypothetical protein